MAKEMKGITYCGECIYYSKKKHYCTAGASVETDPRRTFYDDCPLPEVSAIVHCKDCKYTETDGCSDPAIYCQKWDRWEMPEDFFCAYGKRKDNG